MSKYLDYKIKISYNVKRQHNVEKQYILSVYITKEYVERFKNTNLSCEKPVFEIIMNFFKFPVVVVQLEKIVNYQILQELSKDNLSEYEKRFFSRMGYNYLCILSNCLKSDNSSINFDNINIFVIPVTDGSYGGQKKLEGYYKSMGFEQDEDYPDSFEMNFNKFLDNCDKNKKEE